MEEAETMAATVPGSSGEVPAMQVTLATIVAAEAVVGAGTMNAGECFAHGCGWWLGVAGIGHYFGRCRDYRKDWDEYA